MFELVVPIISAAITTGGLIIIARINKENKTYKPVKEILKNVDQGGNSTGLVEALGILQKELTAGQKRHAEEIQYFVGELRTVRLELSDVRDANREKDSLIEKLQDKVADLEHKLKGYISV